MAIPPESPPASPAADWSRVRHLFDEALQKPPPDRAAFVDSLAEAPAVRAELRSLLAHHDDDTDGAALLAEPIAAGLLASLSRQGERFGAWEIVRAIGTGGMGEVFEARRADGSFEGRAAVKVLKRGMDSAAVLQRFTLERQVLARLDHPNIARLLDAGLSADGLPYFVMEYVDGVTLDEAARGRPLAQRLSLFLQLAEAVAHAHRNLLVHRDLKPGNVLVTPQGQVKLLDFGIAKALDPLGASADTAAANDLTLGAARPFTPNYASPEQVRGEPVSTATDIYSLGCLLYLMLTGVRPTGRAAATAGEAARAVLEEEPTRPSTLSQALVPDPAWAATRKRLQGDLDNILLKALEKPAERRYASVDAFADDVRRFLGGHPVSAHRPGGWYVAGKFVRRHRGVVAAGAAAVLALAVGLAATAWQADQARRARDEAQLRLNDIRAITRDLIARFGDALTYLPGGMKIKEDMLNTALKSLDRLAHSPDRDPGLLAEVAMTYARLAELQGTDQQLSLGKPDAAKVNADKAIELAGQLLPGRRGDWQLAHWTARAYDIRAKLLRQQGRAAEGLTAIDQAAAVLEAVDLTQLDALGRASVPAEQASLLTMRGQLTEQLARKKQAEFGDALLAFDRSLAVLAALEKQRALFDELDRGGRPEEGKGYAQVLSNIAVAHSSKSLVYQRLEDWPTALAESTVAMRYAKAAVDYNPEVTVWKDTLAVESNNTAVVLINLGRFAEALVAAQANRDIAQLLMKQEGETSRWIKSLPPLNLQYGRALAAVGRYPEAVAAYDEGLAHFAKIDHSNAAAPEKAEARRLAAVLGIHRARALLAQGQGQAARRGAEPAAATLQGLAGAADANRRALIDAGDALLLMSELKADARDALRAAAKARFEAAAAMQPLTGPAAAALAGLVKA